MTLETNSTAENRHAAGCHVDVAFVLNGAKTWNALCILPLEKSMSHRLVTHIHLPTHLFCSQQRLSKLLTTKFVVINGLPLLSVASDLLILMCNDRGAHNIRPDGSWNLWNHCCNIHMDCVTQECHAT
jgi:hypothetical protein